MRSPRRYGETGTTRSAGVVLSISRMLIQPPSQVALDARNIVSHTGGLDRV
jgi:hypothetical protein